MEQVIGKRRPILKGSLNKNQYTLSLLQKAYKSGLIDHGSFMRIRIQIMTLLKDMIIRFTGGESSSVKTETAECILNSLYYVIDAYMAGIGDVSHAIEILKTSRIEEIHHNSLAVVSAYVDKSKELFKRIGSERLDFGTEAYDCFFGDLPGFFKHYDMLFAAHDTAASFDYPLLFDDLDSRGIFYIFQYLEKLDLETRFIKLFPKDEVIKLLRNHGRQNRIHYSKLMINIFELVLCQAVLSLLGGARVYDLSLSVLQAEILERSLSQKDVTLVGLMVCNAFDTILNELKIGNNDLISYIRRYEPIFLKSAMAALENHTLSKMATVECKESVMNQGILLNGGERLSGSQFEALVKEILDCENIHGKKELIRQKIKSWQDFIDVLEADCLFGSEYQALFSSLDDMELAVLGNSAFMDDLRDTDLIEFIPGVTGSLSEEWKNEFGGFLSELSGVRLNKISGFMRYMEDIEFIS